MPTRRRSAAVQWCTGYGAVRVGYGWVGIPGVVPPTDHAEEPTQVHPAERAPEALQGLEWVGCTARANGRAGRLLVPPYGPGRSLWALPVPGPSECPPWTNRARIDLISWNLSQNGQVSPKYPEKACHSP